MTTDERLQIRLHGDAALPALIYLPGLHGDWTLVAPFRLALVGRVRFVEFTYPRTLDWSLDDYAQAVADSLRQNGITRGWVIAESFGSQVAWPLMSRFAADGLIIAGGFVRHPWMWGVRLVDWLIARMTAEQLRKVVSAYARIARRRYRHQPEVWASLGEFAARRTEADRRAILHRLRLITANDPRPLARAVTRPVCHLSGFWDPVVPWPFVRPWLRRNCPGFRAQRLVPFADHNVLGTGTAAAARCVREWMTRDLAVRRS